MRSLDETSGPWIGWSVQYNTKIHEQMALRFDGGSILGTGTDADGNFELEGSYDPEGEVAIVRRYTYCTSGPEGVGVGFLYRGRWNGAEISGTWKPVSGPYDGGPFEMWPEEGGLEMKLEESRQAEPVS